MFNADMPSLLILAHCCSPWVFKRLYNRDIMQVYIYSHIIIGGKLPAFTNVLGTVVSGGHRGTFAGLFTYQVPFWLRTQVFRCQCNRHAMFAHTYGHIVFGYHQVLGNQLCGHCGASTNNIVPHWHLLRVCWKKSPVITTYYGFITNSVPSSTITKDIPLGHALYASGRIHQRSPFIWELSAIACILQRSPTMFSQWHVLPVFWY